MKPQGSLPRPASQAGLHAFFARLTPEAKLRLQALAEVEGAAAYRLLEAAFWRYWQSLPARTRDRAERIARILEEVREEAAER